MTTQEMLDERYGRGRAASTRRIVLTVVVTAGILAAAALGWVTWTANADAVDSDATGYELVDDHSVAVTFQVTAPVGRAIACALEAQDVQHGIVGWRVVQYPASDEHARAFTETVPTVSAATTGLVNACWVT